MSKIITYLPKEINPVILIEDKMMTCPICGTVINKYNRIRYSYEREWMGADGIHHIFRKKLNEFVWKRYKDLKCEKCGCNWDTGWFPADNGMFEIPVKTDGFIVQASVNNMLRELGL